MKPALAVVTILLLASAAHARSDENPARIRIEMVDRFIGCARQEIARDLPNRPDDFAVAHARIMQQVLDHCSSEISFAAVSRSYGGDTVKPAAFVEGMLLATAAMLAHTMRSE
jgi:hypothetical protein